MTTLFSSPSRNKAMSFEDFARENGHGALARTGHHGSWFVTTTNSDGSFALALYFDRETGAYDYAKSSVSINGRTKKVRNVSEAKRLLLAA